MGEVNGKYDDEEVVAASVSMESSKEWGLSGDRSQPPEHLPAAQGSNFRMVGGDVQRDFYILGRRTPGVEE
jgi:hypothetical protein